MFILTSDTSNYEEITNKLVQYIQYHYLCESLACLSIKPGSKVAALENFWSVDFDSLEEDKE